MADKIRGALFNVLGDIEGLTALDAFAGSGALALEAISRGAKHVVAIDQDKNAYQAMVKNIEDLGLKDKIKATRANASGWSDNNKYAEFDVVILDPPHDDVQEKLLAKLSRHVKADGILCLSWPGHIQALEVDGFKQIKAKNYGDAQLVFYRRV